MSVLPEFINFANELADLAGTVIRPLFRKPIAVETKSDESPVTLADRRAETIMRERIMARYPDHGIWGEEFGRYNSESKYCWVLDPLDGTKSFISGFPTFGILISLVRMGVPVLGVIDQPVSGERWVGDGKATTFNNAPSKTRACAELSHATLSTTSPHLLGEGAAAFEAIRQQARCTVYGYDCYAYAQLASGHVDAVIESGLKPHDFCALRPVIEGAGGVMTDWRGNPLTLASDGNVLAASDPALHKILLEQLNN